MQFETTKTDIGHTDVRLDIKSFFLLAYEAEIMIDSPLLKVVKVLDKYLSLKTSKK